MKKKNSAREYVELLKFFYQNNIMYIGCHQQFIYLHVFFSLTYDDNHNKHSLF